MINTLSQKLHAWTTGWRVIVLFIAEAVMMGYVIPLSAGILAFAANNSVLPIDLLLFFTPEQAFAILEKYGADSRAFYLKLELTADLLYPIIYTNKPSIQRPESQH